MTVCHDHPTRRPNGRPPAADHPRPAERHGGPQTIPGPDQPPWLPVGEDLDYVPGAVRQAIGTIILPAWQELVLEADGMARSLGMTMVHMMWLELLSQADLSRDYTQVTAVLKLPVDFSGILDQHVKLVNLKLKVAAFLLRLEQHRRKHGPGGKDFDPWADYARRRRAEVDQPDRWESLSPDDEPDEPIRQVPTQQRSSPTGPATPPLHAPPSPAGDANEPISQVGTQQSASAECVDRTGAPTGEEAARFRRPPCEEEDDETADFHDQPPASEDGGEAGWAVEPRCSDERGDRGPSDAEMLLAVFRAACERAEAQARAQAESRSPPLAPQDDGAVPEDCGT